MATITKTISVWVKDDTREVFTEKEIAKIKRDKIADYRSNRDELYEIFDAWRDYEQIDYADLFFASEEARADYLAQFDKYLADCADEDIENEFIPREIEVDIEINAD